LLKQKYPEKIIMDVAYDENNNGAAICYFVGNSKGIMTFYMAQQTGALGKNGLNVLVINGMQKAIEEGYNNFDFGCSSIQGKIENMGVSEFKESFGSKAFIRKSYFFAF
jgi:lipid II:glycine glycyltransferase (peptidoglycan interpeptide bridge formation enzyme)